MTFRVGDRVALKAAYTSRKTGRTYPAGETGQVMQLLATTPPEMKVRMDRTGQEMNLLRDRFDLVASAPAAASAAVANAVHHRRLDTSMFVLKHKTVTNDYFDDEKGTRAEASAPAIGDQTAKGE